MKQEHAARSKPRKSSDARIVLEELLAIRAEMMAEVDKHRHRIDRAHPAYRESACNLLHYLVLRRRDRRLLQRQLAILGLSSLGRAESHVLATIEAVIKALCRMSGRAGLLAAEHGALDFARGEQLLHAHTGRLLGAAAPERGVRIMVTMPSEAAYDYDLVCALLEQGMDCMRINCAHDDARAWKRMIEHKQRAEKVLGKTCQVVMDLAGPKLRTGGIDKQPAVIRIRPRRDLYGRVVAPARVWFTDEAFPQPPPAPADAILPVPAAWLASLHAGGKVKFVDTREGRHTLRIIDVTGHGSWGEATKAAYVIPGTVLQHKDKNSEEKGGTAPVGDLPGEEKTILIHQGDMLILTRDDKPGRPPTYDSKGQLLTPALLGTTLPEVFDDVLPGETIWFDDGKIGGVITQVDEEQVVVRITSVRRGGDRLRSGKGINLPDSLLRLGAMTVKDIEDLDFVAQHADVVELSFANTAEDVSSLQNHLASHDGAQPAIVLKIETRRGFENLPDMLLTAMQSPCCGVMIARGDLAVECGFERLAEVQEEILWICEAAHVPVIWATQVLESLAKEGMPSRAEISDAAMGNRAECVMLNKGPHVLTALRVLDSILRRMQAHQSKKRSMLRELRLAHSPLSGADPEDVSSGCTPSRHESP